MLVGAHYYPWYSPYRHWSEGYTNKPTRGLYDSRNKDIINEHIDEATGHGIDFFNISWWGPNSWEDITIRDFFLAADLINEIKFSIFYETLGTLKWTGVDFDDRANINRLIADFKYIAEEYFDHPSYLKIDGRPVVSIYLTRIFSGDIESAISELRTEMNTLGYDIFILADEVYWQSPDTERQKNRTRLYDGVFSYNMHASEPNIDEGFVNQALQKFMEWKASADELSIEFVPNVLPSFDASNLSDPNPYIISRTIEKFFSFLEGSLDMLSTNRMILITSYNEWHEGTEIESSEEYGTSYLQIVKEKISSPAS